MPTKVIVDTDSTQTLTNKTLTTPTITSPVLSGTSTGTYTLGGTPTISVPTITGLMTIAGQIKFPGTQNASADVNTLDDYEEGTWIPSVGGTATYTTQTGTYTKIGRVVFIHMVLTINLIGTGSVGTVSGLPFANSSADAAVSLAAYSALATNVTALFGRVNASASTLTFFGPAAAANANTGVSAIIGNTTSIVASACYFV